MAPRLAWDKQHRHISFGGPRVRIAAEAQEFDFERQPAGLQRAQQIGGEDKSSYENGNRHIGRIVELGNRGGHIGHARTDFGFGKKNSWRVFAVQS